MTGRVGRSSGGGAVTANATARSVAEGLAGSSSGPFLPFAFPDELELVVDATRATEAEMFFNAARAELSIAMAVPAYLALTGPGSRTSSPAYAEGHTRH